MKIALEVERLEAASPASPAEAAAARLREEGYTVVETSSGDFGPAFRSATGREPPEGAGRPPLFCFAPSPRDRCFFAIALWEGEGLRFDTLRFLADHPEPPSRVFFVALGGEALRAEMESNPAALQTLRKIRESGGLLAAPRDPGSLKLVEFLQARGLVFQKGGHVYLTEEGNALARRK